MPRRKTSLKRTRADKKRHLKNLRIKTDLKKALKKFQALLSAKNTAEAKNILREIYAKFDKAAKKKVIHPNTANRKKSRLMQRLVKSSKSA
jgi:small subunit ribosomal protein S20